MATDYRAPVRDLRFCLEVLCDLDELAARADFVTVHVARTPETVLRDVFGYDEFRGQQAEIVIEIQACKLDRPSATHVEVGSVVEKGQLMLVLEAMKISAEVIENLPMRDAVNEAALRLRAHGLTPDPPPPHQPQRAVPPLLPGLQRELRGR